jgi:beta-glucanase (GH16 family)
MRLFLFLITVVVFTQAAPPQDKGYVLSFEDEFNGTTLNPSHWQAQDNERHSARNSPRAVTLKSSTLTLTTYTEGGKHFTGFVTSSGKFEQTYGYFEAKVHFSNAPGMWAAFWMMPNTYGKSKDPAKATVDGVEIDIVEHLAQFGGSYDTTIHWGGYGPPLQNTRTQRNKPVSGANDGWHIYAVRWEPEGYTFYYDDKLAWSAPKEIPVSQAAQHLLLTCEVQDKGWAGSIPAGGFGSATESKVKMEIDWVRAWKIPAKR